MEGYEKECCVGDYHMYKDIWSAVIGEFFVRESLSSRKGGGTHPPLDLPLHDIYLLSHILLTDTYIICTLPRMSIRVKTDELPLSHSITASVMPAGRVLIV